MSTIPSTTQENRIVLAGSATIQAAEDALVSKPGKPWTNVDRLTLDLSEVEFIEVASLTLIISVLVARQRRGLSTDINIPRSRRVRDFFRRWKFAETIRSVVGTPLSTMVDEEDLRYFKGNNGDVEPDRYAPITWDLAGEKARVHLETLRFFAFQHYAKDTESNLKSHLKHHAAHWNNDLIRAVLEKHLDSPDYLASHILFEALTNAFRHPNAKDILSTSHMTRRQAATGKGAATSDHLLTLVYWDDGQPVDQTLQSALMNGLDIRMPVDLKPINVTFNVKSASNDAARKAFGISDIPTKPGNDRDFLLAAFLPGVTSDPSGRNAVYHPALERNFPELARPGKGLFNIINAACNIFGGTVSVRSNNLFANFKSSNRGTRPDSLSYAFDVKLREYPPEAGRFLGNMLTIRIPLPAR